MTLQGVAVVKGIKTCLLDNEHEPDLVNGVAWQQGGKVTATIPKVDGRDVGVDVMIWEGRVSASERAYFGVEIQHAHTSYKLG